MKKKIGFIISAILLIVVIAGGIYFFVGSDPKDSYTIEESKWIEDNKNSAIDIYMPSDVSILTYNGNGVLFDFSTYLSEKTGLNVSPIAYQLSSVPENENSILLVDKVNDGDIEILEDEYVLIGKNKVLYNSKNQIENLVIGVLKDEYQSIFDTLNNATVKYVQYNSKEQLLTALSTDRVNAIIGLKTFYLNDILTNNYHINYHLYDLKKVYVFRFDNNDELLSSIIKKEYNKFNKEEFNSSFNNQLLSTYVSTKNITEKEITELNSKTYNYGYISNGLFDNTIKGSLSGKNYNLLKLFASFANIDMKYKDEYSNLEKLNEALQNGEIDFYFNNTSFNVDKYGMSTVNSIKSNIVLLTKNNSDIYITDLSGINNSVYVLKNSQIEKYLVDNKVDVNSINSYKEIVKSKKLSKDTIIAIDLTTYEYYKTRGLSNFYVNYIVPLDLNYGFNTTKDNKLFNDLLDFYMEYSNVNSLASINYSDQYEYEGLNIILLILVIVLSLVLIIQFFEKIKSFFKYMIKNRKSILSKDEKLKYIDNLTSLKNRTYLNDNIEKWDNSEIYPQIIIVIDLNNIAYINDNFGHEEGDKVITEAANILIQTQMPRTEIIRTDGNEFLIYMVSYEEKKALSYIRKLNKEFKGLTHEFGAAIGYSIINDAIKTIDDAINEATLDMKTNKEIMNEEEK